MSAEAAETGFDAGIEAGVTRVLVSPEFLYRVEKDRPGVAPGKLYALPDLELASRLSFFLWSSIPDEPLLRAAEAGILKQPAVLERQVRRMLADTRSDALVENFAGGTLARWGLAPADLCREHPTLIVASLSGFGQTGPWSPRPSYDIITQASSGFMSLTGFPDDPPTRGGGSLGDYVQGLFGAIGSTGRPSAPWLRI